MTWRIEQGDCIKRLREMPADSIDAVVTDPPYGIGFMGHDWDQPGDFGPVRANGKPAPFASGRAYPAPHVVGGLQHAISRAQRRGTHHAGTGFDSRASDNGAHEAGRYDFSPAANHRFQAWCEAWAREVLRVLKPGGYLVSFGGTRTYHRMVAGIEDAGMEIRDQLIWLFGSGFPKSRDVQKALEAAGTSLGRQWFMAPYGSARAERREIERDGDIAELHEIIESEDWEGWGTALKPGHEPIVLARKPMVGSIVENVVAHGAGAINIDDCRIPLIDREDYERNHSGERGAGGGSASGARWPANVLLDEEAAGLVDEQSGELVSGANPTRRGSDKFRDVYGDFAGQEQCEPQRGIDKGGASRFFYCAKTSRAERNAGLGDAFPERDLNWSSGEQSPGTFQSEGTIRAVKNFHPTVKPIALMRWLIRLVTPAGGQVLDLFLGSGTTGCAAALEGFDFIGIERDEEYVGLADARIRYWASQPAGIDVELVLEGVARRKRVEKSGQGSLLDALSG